MARPHLTQVQVDDFRSQVCETALEMIAEQGVAGLTLRALAKRLGCSYSKPYRYFRDKEGLIDAVRGHAFDRLGAFMRGDGDAASIPLLDRYLRFAFDLPEAYRVMFELRQDFISPETRAAEARAWKICAQPFHDAVAEGSLVGDPEQMAHVVWAFYHGLASLALANKLSHGMDVTQIAPGLESVFEGFRPIGRRAGAGSDPTPRRNAKAAGKGSGGRSG